MAESNVHQPDLFSLLPDPPRSAPAPVPQPADGHDAPPPATLAEQPECSPRDLGSLMKLHQSACRSLAKALEALLSEPLDLELLDITPSTHGIIQLFCRQRGPLHAVIAQPGSHRLWIHLESCILHAMLYQWLGHSGDVPAAERPLSSVESRLAGRIVTCLTQALQQAYAQQAVIVRLQPEPVAIDPAALRGQTPAAHARFRLRMGRHVGVISLFFSIELAWQLIHHAQQTATSELQAVIAACPISHEQLAQLQPGDVMLSDRSAGESLTLLIDGKPAGEGRIGHQGNQRVILITHIAAGL